MQALKEWATVVKALEKGDQTVLLRKGGILDVASGFQIESKEFFLYPTWEHQEHHHIKPQFHKYLEEVKNSPPKKETNRITSYSKVLAQADISSKETIFKLSSFHVWSDSYIQERINWKPEKPMKAIFLETFKFPEKTITLEPEFQGCKSWININEEIPKTETVLDSNKIQSKLNKFREIVG